MTQKQINRKENAIIKEALKINEQLNKLQEKAEQLTEKINYFADNIDERIYIYELKDLKDTLIDLINFDLEDYIPQENANI